MLFYHNWTRPQTSEFISISQHGLRDAHMRVEVHDQQVLWLSIASDSFLRLQEVCDVVVVQQDTVDRTLVKKRLMIDSREDFNCHGVLVQGASVHSAIAAASNQLRGTDTVIMWTRERYCNITLRN